MKLIDDAYVSFLNLDRRTDRRERMEATLAWIGLKAERTRGGRTWEGDPEKVRTMMERTPGTIGCWLGQVAIMEEALQRGKHALVMEDDLIFCDDWWKRLRIIEDFLSEHPWDIFWFGGTYHLNPPVWHKDELGRDVELTDHPRIVRTYGIWSTYCYLVNFASLEKILTELGLSMEGAVGIDTTFIDMEPELYTYAFAPGCVRQYDDHGDVGGGWTQFSDFAKLGPHWYQNTMDAFDPAAYDWAEARR